MKALQHRFRRPSGTWRPDQSRQYARGLQDGLRPAGRYAYTSLNRRDVIVSLDADFLYGGVSGFHAIHSRLCHAPQSGLRQHEPALCCREHADYDGSQSRPSVAIAGQRNREIRACLSATCRESATPEPSNRRSRRSLSMTYCPGSPWRIADPALLWRAIISRPRCMLSRTP